MSALWAPDGDWPETAPTTEDVPTTGDTATNEGRAGASSIKPRPSLRAVPRAQPRLARVPFILVLIAIFGLGMTGLLMLNTTLQNQAFQSTTLNRQATELAYTQAGLESRTDQLAAPQELARRASALGLRPNPYPAFIVLPKGKVVGKPTKVTGNEVPTLVIKTPAELAADRAAALAHQQAVAAQKVAKARADALAAQAKAAQQKIDDAKAAVVAKAKAAADAKARDAAKAKAKADAKAKAKADAKTAAAKKNGGRG